MGEDLILMIIKLMRMNQLPGIRTVLTIVSMTAVTTKIKNDDSCMIIILLNFGICS